MNEGRLLEAKIHTRAEDADMESLLVELITKEMKRLFGEISCGVFFTYLEKKYGLVKNDIPNKPKIFADALWEVLGSAATVFECTVVKELYLNMGLESEGKEEEYTIVECIRKIHLSQR